jgi:AcrR family transcriptional regulator
VTDQEAGTAYSAQGTRLNRRGLETRAHILAVAVRVLARGGTDVASANLVAREAGVTWGTIQHQFGDTDGVWAAVVAHASERWGASFVAEATAGHTIEERVRAIVATMWGTLDDPMVRAVTNLRQLLPHDTDVLDVQFPATAAAIRRWDAAWNAAWDEIFRGLVRSKVKLRRVRSLLPGAVLGLHAESRRTTFVDADEGRRALVDAVALYLQEPAQPS